MLEDIYNLSGRHLTKEEIAYVVIKRCENMGLNVLNVDNLKQIKNVNVTFECKTCERINTRRFGLFEAYGIRECEECTWRNVEGRFGRNKHTRESLQVLIDELYLNDTRNISFEILDDFIYKNNKQKLNIMCRECGKQHYVKIELLTKCKKSCECVNIRSKL